MYGYCASYRDFYSNGIYSAGINADMPHLFILLSCKG
jgi:hypothetical protein